MKKKFFLYILILILISPWPLLSKTLFDNMGRKIILPDNPGRIISLAPSATEIIFELKQEHRLIGVTLFSDYPPQASKLPVVGSYVHLDLEKIVSLRPDICIGIKDGNPKEIIARLERLNIPVFTVNPTNFDSVILTVKNIGNILNCNDRAKFLIDNIKSRVNYIKTKILKTDFRPGVFFQIGVNPIVSAGTNTLINELIKIAGGKNLAHGPVCYPRFSREQVIALSPELIIITSMSREGGFEDIKSMWQSWPQLPAVKNNKIFLVDSNIVDRPTCRLVQGLEKLAHLIHPKLFEK